MNWLEAVIGKEVRLYHEGPIMRIKYVAGRYAHLVNEDDNGNEVEAGSCPISMLEEVKA